MEIEYPDPGKDGHVICCASYATLEYWSQFYISHVGEASQLNMNRLGPETEGGANVRSI